MNIFDTKLPSVLECRFFSSRLIPIEQSKRTVSKYELDYNIEGGRKAYVNERAFEVEKGSILFRRPGECVKSEGTYNMYALTFTFDGDIKGYNRNMPSEPPYNTTDIALFEHFPSYMKPYHTEEIIEIYRRIVSAFGTPEGKETCSLLVTKLIYLLASEIADKRIPSALTHKSEINGAMAYISENYAEPITLDMIANRVHIDKSYLIRCFKKEIGKTPIEYLTDKRLSAAKTLLKDTDLNISEVAFLCGFSDTSYFTFRFRSSFGITPMIYRKKFRSQINIPTEYN